MEAPNLLLRLPQLYEEDYLEIMLQFFPVLLCLLGYGLVQFVIDAVFLIPSTVGNNLLGIPSGTEVGKVHLGSGLINKLCYGTFFIDHVEVHANMHFSTALM
jgi:hypothetical protein